MIGLFIGVMACVSTPNIKKEAHNTGIHQQVKGRVKRVRTVSYRPVDPPNDDALWLVESVVDAQWDKGLAGAAGELVSTLRSPERLMSPIAMATATSRTGFPGAARFGKTVTNGALPANLVQSIANGALGAPVDVGLAKRAFNDGTVLWVVAWAPHLVDIDPLPKTVPLDAGVTIRVDGFAKADARLFVAPPDAPVRELSITDGVARWVDGFDVPGEYRFEVVAETSGVGRVALLFSIFGDGQPHRMPAAPLPPSMSADPRAAELFLFEAINLLRVEHGLARVERFPLFEKLSREHSAFMGHTGIVAHELPGHGSVASRAAAFAHPRAEHFQNVVGAPTAKDALAMVELSPAHLKNLLCAACTHVSIGAAIEPVLDRIPRLFVTMELLRFPQGAPVEIDHYNR